MTNFDIFHSVRIFLFFSSITKAVEEEESKREWEPFVQTRANSPEANWIETYEYAVFSLPYVVSRYCRYFCWDCLFKHEWSANTIELTKARWATHQSENHLMEFKLYTLNAKAATVASTSKDDFHHGTNLSLSCIILCKTYSISLAIPFRMYSNYNDKATNNSIRNVCMFPVLCYRRSIFIFLFYLDVRFWAKIKTQCITLGRIQLVLKQKTTKKKQYFRS